MIEDNYVIIGEVASDEVARKMIELVTVSKQVPVANMSLEQYLQVSRSINDELLKFSARWIKFQDKLTTDSIVELIEQELDLYPTIKKYECTQRYKDSCSLSKVLSTMGQELTWYQKINVIWQGMVPNRYM